MESVAETLLMGGVRPDRGGFDVGRRRELHRGQGTAGYRLRKMVRASFSNPPFVERLKGILQEVNWDISGREFAQRTVNDFQPKYVCPLFWRW